MRDARGFSLIEAIVATLVTTIAVVGLAHSFGVGRGLIDRYAMSRDALAAAQRRMEVLVADSTATNFTIPSGAAMALHPSTPSVVLLNGTVTASETWTVEWVDDPADGLGGSDPQPHDLKRVTVRIGWTQAGLADTIELSRYFPRS